MTTTTHLAGLGAERFVSLTTYRRNGEPVSTPVWVLADGDGLLVSTPTGTGKLKRIARDPHVSVRPCDRRGRVADDAPTAHGHAEVFGDDGVVEAVGRRLHRKYGLEYRIFMVVEGLLARGNRRRAVIRIADRGRADA